MIRSHCLIILSLPLTLLLTALRVGDEDGRLWRTCVAIIDEQQ